MDKYFDVIKGEITIEEGDEEEKEEGEGEGEKEEFKPAAINSEEKSPEKSNEYGDEDLEDQN